MALVRVPENRESEFIQMFCDQDAFTFEGLDITDKKGWRKLEKAFKHNLGYEGEHFTAYWFTGATMNNAWRLTGDNAYPDDFTFVVVPDYYVPEVKTALGARWFSDIVANNQIKQNAINYHTEPDFEVDDE